MRTRFLKPPVGRRPTVCTAQAENKTFLRRKTQPKSAASTRLPLVGIAALRPLRKEPHLPIYSLPRSGSSFNENMLRHPR